MNRLWNYCSFCGKRIETGEKCYGFPNGESVCADCCVAENEGAAAAEKEKLEVHAKWLRADDFLICSHCEAEMNQKNSLGVDNFKNYCPNCGARMDGDSDALD